MTVREQSIARLRASPLDVLVVGGGINGAACACALAARGAEVGLVERGDFAGCTSQESSNLAWGGIKYLETYELPLVRSLCLARNQLLRSFPTRVREIRFLTTVERGFRHSPTALWVGAWAYWAFGNGATRPPARFSRARLEREEPVVRGERLAGAIEYSDAYFVDNDARFTFDFVRAALDRGAAAANYCESLGAERRGDLWQVRVRDAVSGGEHEVRARVLVNAAGPFADQHNTLTGEATTHRHVYSKGVHLVVDRITPAPRVLAFFADDGRLFFVIPMGKRTCLGTTDTRVERPHAVVTDEDRRFVLDNINARLRLPRPLTAADVIAERCGVRPLAVEAGEAGESGAQDFLQLSRRHWIEADLARRHLTIFGGKLTDCLNVGEEVCQRVADMGLALPQPRARWYGEADPGARAAFLARAERAGLDRFTPPDGELLSARLWRRYGPGASTLVSRIEADPREGEVVIEGTAFVRCELALVAAREMVVRLEDFLRRRSMIALMLRKEEIRRARGLDEACRILFGADAERRREEYFAASD